MGLMDDAKRAAQRSADLAEMSDAKRVDLLRAELAAKDARIAETERCRDNAEAALEAANARIAELEGAIGINKVGVKNLRARAERAEARAAVAERINLEIMEGKT